MSAAANLFLKKQLFNSHSNEEIDEILSHVPDNEILGIDFLLGQNCPRALNEVAFGIVKKAKRNFTPHVIDKNRHHALSSPVIFVAVAVHRKLGVHPVVSKYTVALSCVFGGAYLASNPIHAIPHFVSDAVCYSIHGIGLTPIAEAVIRRLAQKKNEE